MSWSYSKFSSNKCDWQKNKKGWEAHSVTPKKVIFPVLTDQNMINKPAFPPSHIYSDFEGMGERLIELG
jgi:hypothetical protein